MRYLPLIYIAIFTAAGICAECVFAGLPDYKSRKIESKNGKYVLVLLTPKAERWQLPDFVQHKEDVYDHWTEAEKQDWIEDFKKEQAIESEYPESGLYSNDGSTKPLWTVPYISTCQNVYVSNDGIHLVVMYSPWDSNCSGERQLSFYQSGRKVHSYVTEFEFMPFIFLRYFMVLCFRMELPVDEASYIDNEASKFIVQTNQGDELAFDIATGVRTSCSSPWPFYFCFPLVAVPLGVWKWQRRRPSLRELKKSEQIRGFSYSLRGILGLMLFVCVAITLVKLYGWFGAACVLFITIGSVLAGSRNHYTGARVIGALLSLYGAYIGILAYVAIEGFLSKLTGSGPLWRYGGWWLCLPLSMTLLFAIGGALVARRLSSERTAN